MLNIVLYEPEIAENVGNIIRTAAAFNAKLHLIHPLGFYFNQNNAKLKRATVNYIDKVEIMQHASYKEFSNTISKKDTVYFFSRYGNKCIEKINFKKKTNNNTFVIFGKESTGIPLSLLRKNINNVFRIQNSKNVRCLNVANCVAIVSYEHCKQNGFKGLEKVDHIKGKLK